MWGKMMKICFIVDIGSIHAQKWIKYICLNTNMQVYIINPGKYFDGDFYNAKIYNLTNKKTIKKKEIVPYKRIKSNPLLVKALFLLLHNLSCLKSDISKIFKYFRYRKRCNQIINEVRPDIIHSLRVPIEGFLGAYACEKHKSIKFIISTWGNDFTFHAKRNIIFLYLTKKVLKRADFLFSDCLRDVKIARSIGFRKKSAIFPGAGGIEESELLKFKISNLENKILFWKSKNLSIKKHTYVFLFIRGINFSTDDVPIIKALGGIQSNCHLVFIKGHNSFYETRVRNYLRKYRLLEKATFIERIPYKEIGNFIRNSDFVVSSTPHDGVPNSLLETMAYGSIPIYTDLDSIREWINNGTNGYIFNLQGSYREIRDILRRAIANPLSKKSEMFKINSDIIKTRAIYNNVMAKVLNCYEKMGGKSEMSSL